MDRTPPRIGVDGHTCRHGVGHAQIVRGGHPIDQHAQLVRARDGIEHGAVVGRRGHLGQAVDHRPVAKPPIDPAQFTRQRQALQRLVHRVTIAAQRGEVDRRPDAAGCGSGHHRDDSGLEIGHVRYLYIFFGLEGFDPVQRGGGRRSPPVRQQVGRWPFSQD